MPLFALNFSEQTSRPMSNLDDAELERIEGVVRRYGKALDERVRTVSAMRSAAITLDEGAYREAEQRLQKIRDEMEDCSLEL